MRLREVGSHSQTLRGTLLPGGASREPALRNLAPSCSADLSLLLSLAPLGYSAKNKNKPGYFHSYLVLLFLLLFYLKCC